VTRMAWATKYHANNGGLVHCVDRSAPLIASASSFGLCSKTCGGGVQRRVRSITVVPKNGGDVCPALEETVACNNGPCPVDCMQATWTDWSSCNRNAAAASRLARARRPRSRRTAA